MPYILAIMPNQLDLYVHESLRLFIALSHLSAGGAIKASPGAGRHRIPSCKYTRLCSRRQ